MFDVNNLKPGMRFGKLTFVEEGDYPLVKNPSIKKHLYLFDCDCGGRIGLIKEDIGEVTHCGCSKLNSIRPEEINHVLRSYYYGLLAKCYKEKNKHYKNFGAKGVSVYTKWRFDYGEFQRWALANGYKEGLVLDMIDRDKDYTPDNCKWVSLHEFLRGRRDDANPEKLRKAEELRKRLKVGDKIGICEVIELTEVMAKLKCQCGAIFNKPIRELVDAKYETCRHNREGKEPVKGGYSHGETGTRLFNIWDTMKARCYRPSNCSYHRYGGRGIKVCDEWKDNYIAFRDWALANGYEERTNQLDQLTLDRINVDGNYEPSNCRWLTRKDQSNNTHETIKINGVPLSYLCEEKGLPYTTVYNRIKLYGWDIEKALNTPNNTHENLYAGYGTKK